MEEIINLIGKIDLGGINETTGKKENGAKKGTIVILGGYTDRNEDLLRNLINYLKEKFPDKLIILINYLDKIIEICKRTGKSLLDGGRREIGVIFKRTIEKLNEIESEIDWGKSVVICWSFGMITFLVALGWAIKTNQQVGWITPGGIIGICFPWWKNSINFNDLEKKALEEGDVGLNKINSEDFYRELIKVLKELLRKEVNMGFLLPWYNNQTKSFNDGRLKIPFVGIMELLRELLECYSGDSILVITEMQYPGHLASIGNAKTKEESHQAEENLKQIGALIRKMLEPKVKITIAPQKEKDNFYIFLNL